MSYTNDWENLMNGVFGGPRAAQPAKKTGSAADTLDELTLELARQQRMLDEKLKGQTAALRRSSPATGTGAEGAMQGSTNSSSAGARAPYAAYGSSGAVSSGHEHGAPDVQAQALADSKALLKDMEADGLLAKGTADTAPEKRGSFEGLAAEVKADVLGLDAFVDSLIRAMRRPFLLGAEGDGARSVILISGAEGTGRHFALNAVARRMAARGLLKSDAVAAVDLALYANPGAERLFLQDVFAALHAPGEIVAFEHYEQCHPGFLKVLADLATRGAAQLSTRYVVNNAGYLVDAGSALVPGAVSAMTPCSKYLVFFSERGREEMADRFGAAMVAALGDVCVSGSYARENLQALAAQQLNALAQKALTRLQLTLTAGADVRDHIAAQCTKAQGAGGLAAECGKIYRALSEYCLQTDTMAAAAVTLTMEGGTVLYRVNDGEPAPLYDLLPGEYKGALQAVQDEMDRIVGLAPVKEYVTALADNVRVQQRRNAAGMKNASLSMHMIFTGNPGTGKTTIARIVARYLKAIGALSGGQLVEVSRGDLVGRYSGHTAPLTNSVIQSALGGVLFIDEAYSLYRGEQDSFGLEAIDTLVKGMEDHRTELVVILAGYSHEMAEFLKTNSGLASRFPNTIEFPDYSAAELWDITCRQAESKGYTLDAACEAPLLGYYGRRQAEDAATAGNGRMARNTLEKAILNQSRRLVAEPDAALELLLPGDFDLE